MQEHREVTIYPERVLKDGRSTPRVTDGGYFRRTDGEVQVVLEASDGLAPGMHFEKSCRCAQCGNLYKESDVRWFRGAAYGVPCGDYTDIASILRGEQDSRHIMSFGRGEE